MKKRLLLGVLCSILLMAFFSNMVTGNTFRTMNMVFVPASEKSEASEFKSLMDIVAKLTGLQFQFIKVTDYNAAVEAMRAERADTPVLLVRRTTNSPASSGY